MLVMANRKGKSRRRIKDWRRRYRQAADAELDTDDRQAVRARAVKLPPWRLGEAMGQVEAPDGPQARGMVTGLFPGGARVHVGDDELLCQIAGTFRPPKGVTALTVGDDVTLILTRDEHVSGDTDRDMERADGVIISRSPRETAVSRPQASSKRRPRHNGDIFEKVIAANMETMLIVTAARQPRFRPELIDRFCIVAERGEMDSIIVFNKIDLGDPDEGFVHELTGGGLTVLCCSAATGEGVAELADTLRGRKCVLAGASGVGKSTLVNAIVPEADLAVRSIRDKDERGRHCTAAATLHQLPGGGMIVDTPGVRELALEMKAAELPWYFPEMAALAGGCKFNNCTHSHEPSCAVQAAVETGEITQRRYRSYLRILDTL